MFSIIRGMFTVVLVVHVFVLVFALVVTMLRAVLGMAATVVNGIVVAAEVVYRRVLSDMLGRFMGKLRIAIVV